MFACMYYIHASHVCRCLKAVTGRCQVLWELRSQMVVRHHVGAVVRHHVGAENQIKSRSSGRTASALNHHAIFLEPEKDDQSPRGGGTHTPAPDSTHPLLGGQTDEERWLEWRTWVEPPPWLLHACGVPGTASVISICQLRQHMAAP